MKLSAGESFRIALKRENIKQTDLVEKLGFDKRTISLTLKKFDTNKGNINTLIEYAQAAGFEVEFNFNKI